MPSRIPALDEGLRISNGVVAPGAGAGVRLGGIPLNCRLWTHTRAHTQPAPPRVGRLRHPPTHPPTHPQAAVHRQNGVRLSIDTNMCTHQHTAPGPGGNSSAGTLPQRLGQQPGTGLPLDCFDEDQQHHIAPPPPPMCDILSGCCFFAGALDSHPFFPSHVASGRCFCRPLRPVLLLVSFPHSRSPVRWCSGAVLVAAGAVCALAVPSSWRTEVVLVVAGVV